MFTPEKKTILQFLIALAWADGKVTSEEADVIEALFDAFAVPDKEAEALRAWAKEPRTLDDVRAEDLEQSDLFLILQYSVLLSYIDGEQAAEEKQLIDALLAKLNLSPEEAAPVIAAASEYAKSLLPELEK